MVRLGTYFLGRASVVQCHVFTDLWQWLVETWNLLLMDKTSFPLLTAVLLGRIGLICVVVFASIVMAVYAHKATGWLRTRLQSKTDA